MASRFSSTPPVWLKGVAILLILWSLLGCASLYLHFGVGPGAEATEYDRKLYDSLPAWLNIVYVGAVGCGLFGGIALFLRKRIAVMLYAVSFVLVLIQFGWMFLATDIIAAKGIWVTYFPALIWAVQAVQLFVATKAKANGWLN